MTAKEQLHELVEILDDKQVDQALSLLSELAARVPGHRVMRRQPGSLGHGASGLSDLSGSVDDILAEGFGR